MPCKECRISQKECQDWQAGRLRLAGWQCLLSTTNTLTLTEKIRSRNLNREHREDMVKEQVNEVVLTNERDQANVAKTSREESGCEVADYIGLQLDYSIVPPAQFKLCR
jgi:hypothetical protein